MIAVRCVEVKAYCRGAMTKPLYFTELEAAFLFHYLQGPVGPARSSPNTPRTEYR